MSDYNKWFVSTDATETAILCKKDKFIDALKEAVGPIKAAKLFSSFRRATFEEHCKLEFELLEDKRS
jgi:hypothetical protein